MLKDAEELNKRGKLTSRNMNDFGRQVATLPLPLPLLAKTPTSDHGPMHSTPPTTPPTPPPLPLNMSQTATKATMAAHASPAGHSTPATPTLGGGALGGTIAATAPQDHYSLRWNNHQNHILRAFDALLQTKTLVDVTLVCAETSIRAHKMVLSACSPFFQRVFAETPCKHPVIVLKDFRGWVVQAIVDFMYRGEISVPQQRLQTLIQAGESLQVRGLVESSVPEHTPTPAASPDDFGLLDASVLSSSFEDESPSMVRPSQAASDGKLIMPSRQHLFGNPASSMAALRLRRKREQECDRELESDQELGGSSPMPRRKQARPRRRSGDVPHDFALNKPEAETLQTVIKHEMLESMEGEEGGEEDDGPESTQAQQDSSQALKVSTEQPNEKQLMAKDSEQPLSRNESHQNEQELEEEDEDDQDQDEDEEEQDIEELIHTTNELRRQAAVAAANAAAMSPIPSPCPSDGPEDLCTTKKDKDISHHTTHSSDCESNNNNSSKLQDNNQRIMLSLKDIRQLNANPNASSTPIHTPTSCSAGGNGLMSFPPPGMRPPGLPDSPPCHMEALEAQMHAAAAAAVAAAGAGDHPFHHMEHQMEMSLAAAAAAAAMHQRDPRDPRDQCAFGNGMLGPMVMSPFGGPNGGPPGSSGGPGSGCPGQAPHERLEESMNRLSKELGKEFGKDFAKEFGPSSPMSLPGHFSQQDGHPHTHPPSPLPFPGMSSAMTLTPPHMFGLDSPLGLFPPGIDPGKLYNPLMEMSDPRDMSGGPPPFLKKKMPRPKGQHSAPRGGPPRSWTNTELTEALQHVWNKKMTTSQASRIFGIPYNSLLMYVRGKYGKSLKLEQLRKDCISGPPIEMLQMGISGGNGGGGNSSKSEKNKDRKEKDKEKGSTSNNTSGSSGNGNVPHCGSASGNGPPMPHPSDLGSLGPLDLELGLPLGPPGGPRSGSSEPDLLGGPNALFNPFNPQGFYHDFSGGFPGLPLSMLNLLPPAERHHAAAAMHHLGMTMDEDCKSVASKQSSSMDDDFAGQGIPLSLEQRREMAATGPPLTQLNGVAGQD
ncbi:protein jim lovell [Drosophila subobscura]|uniref:protein jim lovell n=1 Tax=Drosophila subobscura TaxID=7241 RepID=UPI00155AC1D1|nr:protein jim lovell [Drosophila subobscura]